MPYDIKQQGRKYAVTKKDGSKTFGTHDSKLQAIKQLAAIKINEKAHAQNN